jgi:IS30 family transposase
MKYSHLTVLEREMIQSMLWEKKSIRTIAKVLKRSHSSILREIKRYNPEQLKRYTPRLAHERALEKRKSRGRKDRLKSDVVRTYVVTHLKRGWSPEQISGCLKKDGIGSVSHEAIYQFIYAQVHRDGYGLLRPGAEDLRVYLRRKRRRRMPKGMRRPRRVLVLQGKSIEIRPSVVDERSRIGDWESDTVESCLHRPGVNTLLERKTGLYFVTKVHERGSAATTSAILKRLEGMPVHTITFDNGSENQRWRELEESLGTKTYFAHPYSSWERGANENANGLLREFFPKGTDFSRISDAEIAAAEYALNTRPRKRLGWKTPLEAWSGALRC